MTAAPHTILIVDDEYASLEVLALLMSAEGFRIVTASDGLEALRKLEVNAVALVITDYKMPRMDGSELCHKLLADPRWSRIPVIFTSATYRQEVPRPGNVVAFFSKPLIFQELLATVRRILQGGSPG